MSLPEILVGGGEPIRDKTWTRIRSSEYSLMSNRPIPHGVHYGSLTGFLAYSFPSDESHKQLLIPVKINAKSSMSTEWKRKLKRQANNNTVHSQVNYLCRYNYISRLIY